MKEIRIFLASSYELEPDRARIGNLIRELNDEYERRDIHLTLVKWEDLDAFYNLRGKQAEYDFQIRNCELFIGLFWHVAGRYTVHEVEVARKSLKPENLLLFRKTARYRKGHEGSEDEKRFLELHPEAKDDAGKKNSVLKKELEAFLKDKDCQTYPDFDRLRKHLTAKLNAYCAGVEVTEEDRKLSYSSNVLQIHVTASPEAEPDLARLGDLVRYLDENSKLGCRVKLIPDIPESDMFVSLCHTSAPKPIPDEIDAAIRCGSGEGGRPRLYFCLKYVAEDAKEQSLKELEERLETVFSHYPDRYAHAAEMKLHFLMQLALLKHPSGSVALTVRDGTICQQLGENKFPLMSCEDMVPLQRDPEYQKLKAERTRLQGKIDALKERARKSKENLAEEIRRLNRELTDVSQQIIDKRNGHFRLARTLEEFVGKEQDEQIADLRELISRGEIRKALEMLPKDIDARRRKLEEDRQRYQAENLREYEICRLNIDCYSACDMQQYRDDICKEYDWMIEIAEKYLQEAAKEAEARNAYGVCLFRLADYDPALEHLEKALKIFESIEDDPNVADCCDNIGNVWRRKGGNGNYDLASEYYERARAIRENLWGPGCLAVALSYNNIGCICDDRGDPAKACKNFKRALAIAENAPDANNLSIAMISSNIGNALSSMGDHDRSLLFHKKALAMRKKLWGENDPDTAVSMYNTGLEYYRKGDLAQALDHLSQALAVFRKVLGDNHPRTISCSNGIAEVLDAAGDHDRARQYRVKTSTLLQNGAGTDLSDTAGRCDNIVRTNESKKYFEKTPLDDGEDDEPDNVRDKHADAAAGMKTDLKMDARKNTPENAATDVKTNLKADVVKSDNAPTDEPKDDTGYVKVNDKTDVVKNDNAPADDKTDDPADAGMNRPVDIKGDNMASDTLDGKKNPPPRDMGSGNKK